MGVLELVPGRECGGCTACCILPFIDDSHIQKKSNTRCRHCVDGCTTYETRPEICRTFYCGWRYLGELGDEWRPDRSGVMLAVEPYRTQGQTTAPIAFSFVLAPDRSQTIGEHWFVAFIREKALKSIPIFVGLYGPPGHRPIRAQFDVRDLRIAANHSAGKVRLMLENLVAFLAAQPSKRDAPVNSGNDVSA